MLTVEEIKKILPHRNPFLFVDRVEELKPLEKVVAYKCVTTNESFFLGHFESKQVMPGVLILEALAQAGCCGILCIDEFKDRLVYIGKITKAKFYTVVVPGDRLKLEVIFIADNNPVFIANVNAYVEDVKVLSAEMTFALQ